MRVYLEFCDTDIGRIFKLFEERTPPHWVTESEDPKPDPIVIPQGLVRDHQRALAIFVKTEERINAYLHKNGMIDDSPRDAIPLIVRQSLDEQ